MSHLKLFVATVAALSLASVTACKLRDPQQEEGSAVFSVNDSNGCVPEGVQEDKVKQDAQTNPTSALTNPGKAAVLLYYGVDSAEPFMAHTVDHEIRDLKAACEFRRKGKSSAVNFIVFLNSYYVAEPSGARYAMCKDGALSQHVLPAEVSGWLAQKRALFTKADINWDQAGGQLRSGKLRYLMRYPVEEEEIRAAYERYPFAHPDFFALLFDHMRQLFPPAQYTYFVHMKSHGSDQLLLTGLTGKIEGAKEECQKKLWDKSMAGLAEGSGGTTVSTSTTLPFKPTRLAGAGERGPDDEMHLTLIGLGDSTVARVPVCLLRVGPNKELFGETRVEGGARLADLEVGEKKFCDWRFGEMSAPPAATGGEITLGDVRLGDVRLGDVRLGDVRLGDVRLGDVRLGDVRLGDVRLGDARLGDVRLGDVRLGDSRLGDSRLSATGGPFAGAGLGSTGSGLGTYRLGNDGGHLGITGLGAGNHFGMPSYALNGVLVDLIKNLKRTPDEAPTEVAFLMLESCDSKMVNKDPIARHLLTLVPELKAYYSAKGSLWYRNLDWDDIFMEWQMSPEPPTAGALQARLLGEVKQVVNYVPK